MNKRYFFSVVEEFWPGHRPDVHVGRIEVYDNTDNSGHAVYEARFVMPTDLYELFRETFDFKESDIMPYVVWDFEEE